MRLKEQKRFDETKRVQLNYIEWLTTKPHVIKQSYRTYEMCEYMPQSKLLFKSFLHSEMPFDNVDNHISTYPHLRALYYRHTIYQVKIGLQDKMVKDLYTLQTAIREVKNIPNQTQEKLSILNFVKGI